MSAQAGILSFDGKPVDEGSFEKLTLAIEHCGPDGGDIYINGSIGMTYSAFHTTPESRLERQPYVTDWGDVITWDGRLDNRDDLIRQLSEEPTANRTDVSIIAAAFRRWGTDCFRRIIGDWAVSIWTPLERRLLLACDYMCIRHIFYYLKKDSIWWSTDLTPLVRLSGSKFHVDDDYIAGYFANDPDAYRTAFREIRQVPPGQIVSVCNAKLVVERFWHFTPKSRIRYKTDADYEEHFRYVFRQSVRRRLRSDSPILAELSGGLDSSSIVCMADDILAKEGAPTPRVDTLSYYDKSEPNGDDWIYFHKIEKKRGRAGVHIDLSGYGDSASFEYPRFCAQPGYLGAGRNIEAERAGAVRRRGTRATLSGIGGDEFLGGVPNPTAHLADLIVQLRFVSLAKQLTAWSLAKRRPWIWLLWEAALDLVPPSLGQYLVREARVEPWIEKEFSKRANIAVRQIDVDEHFGLWLPSRRAYIGGLFLMANKMAKLMPAALMLEEARYPYLDQDVIEFILSIPADQLLRPGERRSLMRRALAETVPQEVLSRRTKQLGARTPILALERNWQELQTAFRSPFTSQLGYMNRNSFSVILHDALNGKPVHLVKMLRAVSLEFWLRDLTMRCLIDVGLVTSQQVVELTVDANA
jgi:asparagine synthase (glutamine-hydrolysing)